MVKQGTVDFIIGQDVKTQGTLPIRLLYDYLERHQFPKERMNMTDITIKFRGNVLNSCICKLYEFEKFAICVKEPLQPT